MRSILAGAGWPRLYPVASCRDLNALASGSSPPAPFVKPPVYRYRELSLRPRMTRAIIEDDLQRIPGVMNRGELTPYHD